MLGLTVDGSETVQVTVEYFLTFREQAGKKSDILEIGEEATVRDILDQVATRYGEGFRDALFDRGENLREYVRVLVDGRDVQGLSGLSTGLRSNCIVSIFPPAGGGAK